MQKWYFAIMVLLLTAGGCVAPQRDTQGYPSLAVTSAPPGTDTPPLSEATRPPAVLTSPDPWPGDKSATETAISDLAARLDVDPAEIELVSETRQEMRMQNLGCPSLEAKTDKGLPAFVIGTEIVLRHPRRDAQGHDENEYVYHALNRRVVYCGQR